MISVRYEPDPEPGTRITEEEIRELFRPFGIEPWGPQKFWARRFLMGESFCLLSPTGTGKTTAVMAFSAVKRSLIVVPTSTLAAQIQERLEAAGIDVSGYHSLSRDRKDGKVVVTTSAFLSRKGGEIPGGREAVFVDDVDGFLRRSKAIDSVFRILGIEKEAERAFESAGGVGPVEGKQIIVSGATQTARRTLRVRVLRSLFGFDIGTRFLSARNVHDFYLRGRENLVNLVRMLGPGGFVYARGEELETVSEKLESAGIPVAVYRKASRKLLRSFERGEVWVLLGTMSRRSSLVRGVDLPESLKYVIFYGVPSYEFDPARLPPERLRSILRRKIYETGEWKEIAEKLSGGRLEEPAGLLKKTRVPDPVTYIQGSGRTSRLTGSGLTAGISVVLVDDREVFEKLKEEVAAFGVEFREANPGAIERVKREVEESRKGKGKKIDVKTRLLVVESPTKARTISRLFGSSIRKLSGALHLFETVTPDSVLLVTASGGHISDLNVSLPGYGARLDGTLELFFELKKPEFAESLMKVAGQVDEVLIATDPDPEGEKIAWDLKRFCEKANPSVKRVRFHEITRNEVESGLREPGDFDENLLKAQLLRRVEDAWIGLSLSEVVQKEFGRRTLSAGRVQTPVLGWVVDREEELRKKLFLITAVFENGFKTSFRVREPGEIRVLDVERVKERLQPGPPHTTDTVLSAFSADLGSERVMEILQDLFECGLITYHRTDSTHVSPQGSAVAGRYLKKKGIPGFSPKSWGPKGTHECIRPTRPLDAGELMEAVRTGLLRPVKKLGPSHYRVYSSVFRRFVCSQMEPAEAEIEIIRFRIGGEEVEKKFVVSVSGGWAELGGLKTENPGLKPGWVGTEVSRKKVPETYPYTESSLVEKMKKTGIGRPSTYAVVLRKLKERRYVLRFGKVLRPSRLGKEVCAFLRTRYGALVSEERTRTLEREMDEIERGEADIVKVLEKLKGEMESLGVGEKI